MAMFVQLGFEFGCIIFICFGIIHMQGTVFKHYRRVQGTEDVSKGQLPQYNVDFTFDSITSCVAFADLFGSKLLSFEEQNKKCSVYTQRGPVRSVSTGEIFFGKVPELEADFIFSEEQNMWYKFSYCSNCFAVDAYRLCENLNARAIYVDSPARQQFLKTVLQGKNGLFFLIDGTDSDQDHVFTHSNGAVMTYTNFKSGEPSRVSGLEHCIAVVSQDNFKWHDIHCSAWVILSGVVCEITP